MNAMLANDIGGGIFALLVIVAGLVSSVLALAALIPANRGKRAPAIVLFAPAIVTAATVTVGMIWQCATDRSTGSFGGRVLEWLPFWILFAGPPLLTGAIAILVL